MRRLGLIFGFLVLVLIPRPSWALPKFAREYHVSCRACHTTVPRLNLFGLAFQANYYNWPDGKGPQKHTDLASVPVSGQLTSSIEWNRTEKKTTADFRELELYLYDGFSLGGQRRGGYYLDVAAVSTDAGTRSGDLGNAWVAVPFAGKRGQWSVTLGQISPLFFQYSSGNSLTDTLPFAITDSVDDFSFNQQGPGIRLDYFNNRGRGTANGDYVAIGVPFAGQLALNHTAAVHDAHGGFVHAFRRRGYTTLGAFGYTRAGNGVGGIMATQEARPNLYLTGIATAGHDRSGDMQHLSLEAEYLFNVRLAVTGRLELVGGSPDDLGAVAAVTYYPLKTDYFRLTAEMRQRKGDRSFILFGRAVF